MFNLLENSMWIADLTYYWRKSLLFPAGIILGAGLMIWALKAAVNDVLPPLAIIALGILTYFIGWVSWAIYVRGSFAPTVFSAVASFCWGFVVVFGLTLVLVLAAVVIKFS